MLRGGWNQSGRIGAGSKPIWQFEWEWAGRTLGGKGFLGQRRVRHQLNSRWGPSRAGFLGRVWFERKYVRIGNLREDQETFYRGT